MSATARDYQSPNPPSTEGLDHLFEPVSDTVQVNVGRVQDSVQPVVQDTVQSEITVLEASRLLNVDRRSIVRLLHWQKLSGRKDESGKWLVDRNSVRARLESSDTVQVNVGRVQDTVQLEVLDSVLSEIESDLDVSSSKNDQVQDTVLAIVQQQSEQLKNAYTYLDAATARILYLQQQLENKDQEIKLLTDSQHKAGWWSRLLNRIGIK